MDPEPNIVHFQNYFRLNFLLTTQGCGILRHHFRERYKLLTNKNWRDGSEEGKEFLRREMNASLKHLQKIPKNMLETGDSGKWDITALSALLTKTVYGLNEEYKEQNKNILLLTELRNKLAHLPDKVLLENEFMNFWLGAEKVLVDLGVPWEDIEDIRTGPGLVGIELKERMIFRENIILATRLCTEGNEAVKSNRFEEGIQYFSRALGLQGLSEDVRGILLSNRSHAYLKFLCGKESPSDDDVFDWTQLALEDARAAIFLQPTWWRGYLRAARVYQFLKENQAANILLEKALELNPSLQSASEERDEYHCIGSIFSNNEGPSGGILCSGMAGENPEETGIEDSGYPRDEIREAGTEGRTPEDSDAESEEASVAHCCMTDNGLPIDSEVAVQSSSEVAVEDSAEATYKLGLQHLNGLGFTRDVNVAVELFEKAAKFPTGTISARNVGVADAKYLLGKCYEEGIGKPQDIPEAIVWYTRASNEGLNEATNKLAQLYSSGGVVEKNSGKALRYWITAAKRGDAASMKKLASEYLKRQKITEAESWFCRFQETGEASESEIKRFQKALAAQELRVKCNKETSAFLKPSKKKAKRSVQESLGGVPATLVVLKEYVAFGKCFDFESQIRQKVEAESDSYARKLLSAMELYVDGMALLGLFVQSEGQIVKAERKKARKTLLKCFSNCFLQISITAVEIPHEFQSVLEKITEEVIYGTGQHKSPQDRMARIIRSKLLETSLDQSVEFVRLSIEKYPTEEYFQELECQMLSEQGRYEEGKKIIKAAIKSFPSNYEFRYFQAELIRCGIEEKKLNKSKTSTNLASLAYQTFLKMAPIDHPKSPSAYFGLAVLSFWQEKFSEGEDYFKRGLEIEKTIMPCFVLEKSSKSICQTLYPLECSKECTDPAEDPSDPKLSRCSSHGDVTSDYYTQEAENRSDEEESDCRSDYPKDSTDSADCSEGTYSSSSDNETDPITAVEEPNYLSFSLKQSPTQGIYDGGKESTPSKSDEESSWGYTGVLIAVASTILLSSWLLKK